MKNKAELSTQFKATITLFGASDTGKTELLNNLIYQIETKSQKGTPGYDILYYNTKTNNDKGDIGCQPLLIRFLDMGKFDIEANKERIIEITKMSNIICFVIDVLNLKSAQYFDAYTTIQLNSDNSAIILILNKNDNQKLFSLQSDIIKQIKTDFKIKDTIEVCSIKRESVNAFGDLIRSRMTNMIENNNERYSYCEKEFNTCPELIYVKKIKKTFGCI